MPESFVSGPRGSRVLGTRLKHSLTNQLNERKCKELRIGFNKKTPRFVFIQISNKPIEHEVVENAKVLGLYANIW